MRNEGSAPCPRPSKSACRPASPTSLLEPSWSSSSLGIQGRSIASVGMSSALRPLWCQASLTLRGSSAQIESSCSRCVRLLILRHSAFARSCSCHSASSAARSGVRSGVRSPLHVLLSATATTGWKSSARPSKITPSSSWRSASRRQREAAARLARRVLHGTRPNSPCVFIIALITSSCKSHSLALAHLCGSVTSQAAHVREAYAQTTGTIHLSPSPTPREGTQFHGPPLRIPPVSK